MKRRYDSMMAAVALGGGFLLSGCATDELVRVPAQLGPIEKNTPSEEIELSIRPDDPFVVIGRPLEFIAEIRNISGRDLWLPKTPRVVFLWTYPNGRRDNLVFDPLQAQHYTTL